MLTEISIRFELDCFNRAIKAIGSRHLPYATRLALNETAKGARLVIQKEMDRVFDRPTPYAKRGVIVDWATRESLRAAVVVTGNRTKGALPATAFLGPQINGGQRTHKAFERQLIDRGLMERSEVAVPASRTPLDRYGSMTQGFLNRVMADLQIDYRGAGATRVRSVARLKRNQNYRKARYFVPKRIGHLFPGVWQRNPSDQSIFPVILFIRSEGYRIRLHFQDVVHRHVDQNIESNFIVAFDHAMRTAR